MRREREGSTLGMSKSKGEKRKRVEKEEGGRQHWFRVFFLGVFSCGSPIGAGDVIAPHHTLWKMSYSLTSLLALRQQLTPKEKSFPLQSVALTIQRKRYVKNGRRVMYWFLGVTVRILFIVPWGEDEVQAEG